MTSPIKKDAEFESIEQEIETLEKESEEFLIQRDAHAAKIKHLREAEDPSTGVYYAQEIFTLSQEKLRLAAEADIRQRKANRLRLGNAPSGLLQ